MKNIVYILGVFVLTSILYAIPVLTACSFIYEWGVIQLMLILASLIEFCGLSALIIDKVSKGE